MTQSEALTILKTGANVFLTGEPGAGKTHTINAYVAYLRMQGIEPAITASTGIAATHIGGMTIHSWAGIGIQHTLDKYALDKIASTEYVVKRILKNTVLIIDEISMLGPNTLSMVDAVCREVKQVQKPFGGMQVILVGDFFQLPPINKNNFYNNSTSNNKNIVNDSSITINTSSNVVINNQDVKKRTFHEELIEKEEIYIKPTILLRLKRHYFQSIEDYKSLPIYKKIFYIIVEVPLNTIRQFSLIEIEEKLYHRITLILFPLLSPFIIISLINLWSLILTNLIIL
jgi:ATP-dependent exoDNAse (exonuclease V) alpha subunit